MNPSVDFDAIPEELRELDKWLVWDTSKERKRPFTWDSSPEKLFGAKKHTAAHHLTFEEAVAAAEASETVGIGLVFDEDDPYVGIDLDGCNEQHEDGRVSPREWLPTLRDFDGEAYAEQSPSGDGLHLWVRGSEIPDWWSNIQKEGDEHIGVEVYTKWFFTVTGDVLEKLSTDEIGSVDLEPFLRECHKSLKGNDPLADGSLSDYDAGDGEGSSDRTNHSSDEYDGDEWLDRGDVEEALGHIAPTVKYTTWRDIGFALVDFFDEKTDAAEVFEKWSKGEYSDEYDNPRAAGWDADAKNLASDIIGGAGDAGDSGRTIGTVIHRAEQEGWDMPAPSSGASKIEPDGEVTWEYVRELFENSDVDDKRARRYAAIALTDRHEYLYVDTDDRLLKYHEDAGVFEPGGERHVRKELARELGMQFSTHDRNEVLATVQDLSAVDVTTLNAEEFDEKLICVENGVLNIETRELNDHDPKYRFTQQIPVSYDPDASAEDVESFLDDVTQSEPEKKTLVEMIGATLHPEYLKSKFLFLFGEGQNGKGVYFDLIARFLGSDNVEGRGLHELADNRFAKADLHGKLANIGGDIDDRKLKNVGTLKRLTSNTDPITAERKFGQPFKFVNSTTLFFAANEPPAIDDMKRSMGRRIVPIHMATEFINDPDPNDPFQKEAVDKEVLLGDMTTEKELSGLLNMALNGMDRLRNTGDVSLDMSPMERLEFYQRFSDPIYRFANDCLEKEPGSRVEKADVYEVYKSFSRAEGHGVRHNNVFWREFRRVFHFDETRRREDGDLGPRELDDARFTEKGLKYAADHISKKYAKSVKKAADEARSDGSKPTLKALEPGRHTVEVTIAERLEPKPWQQGRGHVVDADGNIMKYVAEGATSPFSETRFEGETQLEEGDRARITNAKIATDRDGVKRLEVSGVCEVTPLPSVDGEQSNVADAAADGGNATDGSDTAGRDAAPQYTQAVAETVRDATEPVGVAYIIQHTEGSPDALREAIDSAREQGKIRLEGDDSYAAAAGGGDPPAT